MRSLSRFKRRLRLERSYEVNGQSREGLALRVSCRLEVHDRGRQCAEERALNDEILLDAFAAELRLLLAAHDASEIEARLVGLVGQAAHAANERQAGLEVLVDRVLDCAVDDEEGLLAAWRSAARPLRRPGPLRRPSALAERMTVA